MPARLKTELPSEAETLERLGVPSHEEVAARAYELFEELAAPTVTISTTGSKLKMNC